MCVPFQDAEEDHTEGEVWENEDDPPDFFDDQSDEPMNQANFIVCQITQMILKWQATNFTSDHTVLSLLILLKSILKLVHGSAEFSQVVDEFPQTLYSLRKMSKVDRDDFESYVVCQTCSSTYRKETSTKTMLGKRKLIFYVHKTIE